MDDASSIDRDLLTLGTELKRLEVEYTMFFAGQSPRPPLETRRRVEALVKRYDRAPPRNSGARFRFQSLQARFSTLTDLWDRGLRAREEGRAGPFSPVRRGPRDDDRRG